MDTEISYHNNGDVALNLPDDWDRSMAVHNPMVPLMVGHTNGKADIFLTSAPNERHQFQWVEFNDKLQKSLWKLKGYEFVRKSEGWEIDELLFTWDAEGYVVNGSGQRGMFRSEAAYQKDKAELEANTRKLQRHAVQAEDEERDLAFAQRTGAQLTDGSGRPLVKKHAGGRPRKNV